MKPFKISMEKGDGMELYGQGETLCEAMTNLIRAVDEFGDAADMAGVIQGSADLADLLDGVLSAPAPRRIEA